MPNSSTDRGSALLQTEIVTGIAPEEKTTRKVAAEFRKRLREGFKLKPTGLARDNPQILLDRGYTPRYELRLFDTVYYLTDPRVDDDLGFFIAYVQPGRSGSRGPRRELYPQIFYKDISLVWRSASHVIRTEEENWVGKGALKPYIEDGEQVFSSAEETTDLPFEIQAALDGLSRIASRPRRDTQAVPLILHNAPDNRLRPYEDFEGPRRRASSDKRNLVNGARKVAFFTRDNDPESLRFVRGYEPDFTRGVLEMSRSRSRLYKGNIRKFRILSKNRTIQYQFITGPRRVWIVPPQALTTEIMRYGVRTIDVHVDDDLCVPGFEYHYLDQTYDPPELHSQIPQGFAGRPSDVDPARADATAWISRLPVVREFREKVLRQRVRPGGH
ncbi:MAG: hypothetical protein GY725_13285 [bacterium]|nr:hypothetical protein [bacterium]